MSRPDQPFARAWLAGTALVVVVAFALQIPVTAAAENGFLTTPLGRVANLFAFFTILSNLLVAVTSTAMAVRPDRDGPLLRMARFDAVLAITVTGVVDHALLAGLYDLHGAAKVADTLFHTVSPLLTVTGWLVFGPRGWVGRRVVVASLAYPLAWLGCTLVRGAFVGWYPYPFLDVTVLGYARVAANAAGITVVFLVLAAAFAGLDRLLPRQRPAGVGARIVS